MPRGRQGRDGVDLGVAAVAEVDDPRIIEAVDPAAEKGLDLIGAGRLAGDADRPESLADLDLRTVLHGGICLRGSRAARGPSCPRNKTSTGGFLFRKSCAWRYVKKRTTPHRAAPRTRHPAAALTRESATSIGEPSCPASSNISWPPPC